jgi:hypothetical protein
MNSSTANSVQQREEGLDRGGGNVNEPFSVETEGGCAPDAPGRTSSSALYQSLTPPRTLELTMFERLEQMYGPGIKCMLTVQYRYVIAPAKPGQLS